MAAWWLVGCKTDRVSQGAHLARRGRDGAERLHPNQKDLLIISEGYTQRAHRAIGNDFLVSHPRVPTN